jgi:hypothetical protein
MYYRNSIPSDVEDTSGIRFGLVVAGVAIIVVRAAQLFGLDFATTIQSLASILR